MPNEYNDFCWFCTGHHSEDIDKCSDTNCPFHPFRSGGLEKDVEQEIVMKLLQETHLKG